MISDNGWMFLLNSLTVGGSEKKTVNISNYLVSKGYEIHVGYLSKPETLLESIDDDISTYFIGRKGKFDLSVPQKLRNYWVNNNISAVWCVNPYPALYAYFAARPLTDRPRLIASTNTTKFRSSYERLQMLAYAPVFRRFDALVFGSELQQRQWVEKFSLSTVDHRVIHNGVDTSAFKPFNSNQSRTGVRERFGIKADEICLGSVAQFRPEKAHTDLITALEKVLKQGISCHLLLVGEGSTKTAMQQLVATKGLNERVTFLGTQKDVRESLAAMDIFILASTSVETFSNAALEAMAMGTAVILTRIGGAAEMMGEGDNGILYEPGNIEELVSAICRLSDTPIRDRYARNARTRVCDQFSVERMANAYIATLANTSL